jgi:flagellin-like protein
MRLKQLFADDNAVSPVIGVILMVAITVILAAVIASFVLGLGNNAASQTPTATIGFDYEDTNGTAGYVTVTHDGGDSISHNELYIRGSGITKVADPDDDYPGDGTDGEGNITSPGTWDANATSGDDSRVVSGDRVYVGVLSDYEISTVYQSQEGDTSSTLNTHEGPDA